MNFILYLKKGYLFFKQYKMIIFFIVYSAVLYFIFRRNVDNLYKLLDVNEQYYKKEIDIINKQIQDQKIEKQRIEDLYKQKIDALEALYKENNQKLLDKQKKDIEKYIKEYSDDPEKIKKYLEEYYGLKEYSQ